MNLRLEIDPLRLDDELIGQPKQRQVYGELLADAQLELDNAKSTLSVVQAETDRDVRECPADYGIDKLSEARISAAVTASKPAQLAQKNVNKTRHKVNVLQAAVDGLEHRRAALKAMVELHGQSYFAAPSMPSGIKAENRRRERDDSDHVDD